MIPTTVTAFLQRLPPVAFFPGRLAACAWAAISVDGAGFLANNGFHRADTVRELAVRVRGDHRCLPDALGDPVRIDFFGDEIDSMRHFDAMSHAPRGG